MSVTLTEQAHLFDTTGTTLITNGDPLHSRVMKDFPRMLNNLWAYVDTAVGYCLDPSGSALVPLDSSSAVVETYVGQCQTVIPQGSVRLVFTAGLTATATALHHTTVSAVNVYLSATPYLGASSPRGGGDALVTTTTAVAFDVTNLSADYTSCGISRTVVATATTSSYSLLDTTTGVTPINCIRNSNGTQLAYLVITLTGKGDGNGGTYNNYANFKDLTWWFIKE